MKVLRQRNGQVLVRIEDISKKYDSNVEFEWWYDIQKMNEGVRIEEKNDKTYIYCYIFKGNDKESWLIKEFDKRVPKTFYI